MCDPPYIHTHTHTQIYVCTHHMYLHMYACMYVTHVFLCVCVVCVSMMCLWCVYRVCVCADWFCLQGLQDHQRTLQSLTKCRVYSVQGVLQIHTDNTDTHTHTQTIQTHRHTDTQTQAIQTHTHCREPQTAVTRGEKVRAVCRSCDLAGLVLCLVLCLVLVWRWHRHGLSVKLWMPMDAEIWICGGVVCLTLWCLTLWCLQGPVAPSDKIGRSDTVRTN